MPHFVSAHFGIDCATLVLPLRCRGAVAQQKRATSPKEMTFYAIWPRMSKLTGPYCIKKPPLLRRLSFVVLGMGFEPMISRMRILRPGPARRTELVVFRGAKIEQISLPPKKIMKKFHILCIFVKNTQKSRAEQLHKDLTLLQFYHPDAPIIYYKAHEFSSQGHAPAAPLFALYPTQQPRRERGYDRSTRK